MTLLDCPCCGQPESSYDDTFCGKCESRYHEEQERLKNEEIASIRERLNACECQADGPDEPCGTCYRRYARILSLQGREHEAEAMLNR